MQKFRGILRVGFEIAFRMGHFFNDKILITWAAERVPPRAAKTAGNHPDHLGDGGGVGGVNLVYVVEGHASACPRTVGVDVGRLASTGMLRIFIDV